MVARVHSLVPLQKNHSSLDDYRIGSIRISKLPALFGAIGYKFLHYTIMEYRDNGIRDSSR